MAVDDRAVLAAGNNADLYRAVFETHGLRFERHPFAFVGLDDPPPYYSNLTVLQPDHSKEIVAELAQLMGPTEKGLGLKDSFCELDLVGNGFETLFEASWVWRDAMASKMPEGWDVIEDAPQLALWERAWNANGSPMEGRLFPGTFLERTDTFFLGKRYEDRYVAGCIANLSEHCVGLSNLYAETPSPKLFADAAEAVGVIAQSLPIVGYESGDALEFAASAGFEAVHGLRILVSRRARF